MPPKRSARVIVLIGLIVPAVLVEGLIILTLPVGLFRALIQSVVIPILIFLGSMAGVIDFIFIGDEKQDKPYRGTLVATVVFELLLLVCILVLDYQMLLTGQVSRSLLALACPAAIFCFTAVAWQVEKTYLNIQAEKQTI